MYDIPNVNIPDGISEAWKVEKKHIVPSKISQLQSMLHGNGRYVPEGTYTFLYRNCEVIMSDTPDEKSDHYEAVMNATGNVLIAGLGIGMILNAIALNQEVTHIDLVEISPDVVNLVWPTYKSKFGDKITLYQMSIFDFKPTIHYDYAWFDIWNNLNEDNLKEMAKLGHKFGKHATKKGYWGKEYLLYNRRRNSY
jgi:hypothetical protein